MNKEEQKKDEKTLAEIAETNATMEQLIKYTTTQLDEGNQKSF